MKTLTIGILACVLLIPTSVDAASKLRTAGDKFESIVPLNYARVAGSRGAAGGYHGAYRGYRGGYAYRGGYYGRGRYGGYYPGRYGYRYPYGGYYGGWYGGYYPYWGYGGFTYYSGFAYGAGWPGYYYGGGPYVVNEPRLLLPPLRTASVSRGSNRSGGSFITNVQSALKSQGYYAGPVDGDFGPSSQKAFASFQQAKGMPPTGTLDSPALAALGVGGKTTRATAKSAPVPPRKTPEATFEPPPVGPPDQPPAISPETPPVVAPATPPVIPREPPAIPGGI